MSWKGLLSRVGRGGEAQGPRPCQGQMGLSLAQGGGECHMGEERCMCVLCETESWAGITTVTYVLLLGIPQSSEGGRPIPT